MKRTIAVVDDERSAFERLQEQILRYSKENHIDFDIKWFQNGDSFLMEKEHFSIIVLDIELPDDNGLNIAKEVRKNNNISSIIFVTNMAKYAQYGYEVDAISYLVKPVEYESFAPVFTKALNTYASHEEKDLIFKIPGGVEVTSISKIMYIEIISHVVIYHLIDGTIERVGSLSKIEKELSEHDFVRTHSAFLVNLKFVRGVDKNDVIVGDKRVPLARSKKKEFFQVLSAYYLKKN